MKKFNFNKNLISGETLSKLSFGKIAFQEGTSHLKRFIETHLRTPNVSNTLCDNFLKFTVTFVIRFHKAMIK